MTQSIIPIRQSPLPSLRDALQIAVAATSQMGCPNCDSRLVFERIAQLLGHAIEGLSEPSLAAMQAGEILLKEWSGTPEPQRQLRDTIAGILQSQLTGVVPPTWQRND